MYYFFSNRLPIGTLSFWFQQTYCYFRQTSCFSISGRYPGFLVPANILTFQFWRIPRFSSSGRHPTQRAPADSLFFQTGTAFPVRHSVPHVRYSSSSPVQFFQTGTALPVRHSVPHVLWHRHSPGMVWTSEDSPLKTCQFRQQSRHAPRKGSVQSMHFWAKLRGCRPPLRV